MANVVITMKIMPDSAEMDLSDVQSAAIEKITAFAGKTETKTELEPIAFGLSALNIIFVMDEAKGSTDELEKEISGINGVNSVEVSDVRRAIG